MIGFLLINTLLFGAGSISNHPNVVSDGCGGAVAVWLQTSEGQTALLSSFCHPQSGWITPPYPLSSPNTYIITVPQLAVNAAGEAVAVWGSYHPSLECYTIEAAFANIREKCWSSPQLLTCIKTPFNHDIKVSLDLTGLATVVWSCQAKEREDEVQVFVSLGQPSGPWSKPLILSGSY